MTTVGIQAAGSGFEKRWPEFLRQHGADVRDLELRRTDWRSQLQGCDGVMWHYYHGPDDRQVAEPLLQVIESVLGIPVFPNQATAWHFDNKNAQAMLAEALDLPSPRTWVFWNRQEALAWCASEAGYPLVAKFACGAGSSNVRLLRHRRDAESWIRMMFSRSGRFPGTACPVGPHPGAWRSRFLACALRALYAPTYILWNQPALPRIYWWPQRNYALFQEFLPGNTHDTRITVIGNRAFGYRRFNRPADFRASGSGNFDLTPERVDQRCVKTAFSAADKLRSQSMAFDFLMHPATGQPVIVEFSFGFVSDVVHRCPGHWDRQGNWHPGNMWPEEAHVVDFLRLIQERKPA